jgi:hypothetical protein
MTAPLSFANASAAAVHVGTPTCYTHVVHPYEPPRHHRPSISPRKDLHKPRTLRSMRPSMLTRRPTSAPKPFSLLARSSASFNPTCNRAWSPASRPCLSLKNNRRRATCIRSACVLVCASVCDCMYSYSMMCVCFLHAFMHICEV